MNHHYTAWQRAKWLIPGCREAGVHSHGFLGATNQTTGTTQQTSRRTAWCSSQGHMLEVSSLFGKFCDWWARGAATWGSKFLSSNSKCQLLRLWGLILSRNWEVCRMASQQVTGNPNGLQGKQKTMARTRQATNQDVLWTTSQESTSLKEGPDLVLKLSERTLELPASTQKPQPQHPGKLGQGARSPEPSLHFLSPPPLTFSLTQLCSIFCPWGF